MTYNIMKIKDIFLQEVKRVYSLRIFCFLISLVFSSSGLHADVPDRDLFKDVIDGRASLDAVDTDIVTRQRLVNIEFDAIDPRFEVIYLNIFDDFYVTAVRDHVETDAFSGVAWLGSIDGIEDSKVTLVIDEDKLSGIITLPDVCYHIRPLENGTHVIREIDPGALEDSLAFSELVGLPGARVLDSHDVLEDTRIVRERSAVESSAGFVSQEQTVFNLVNEERAIRGLHALTADSRLTAAARAHSRDMSQNNFFSHNSQDGRGPGDRITSAGYAWNTFGENIAVGFTTPEAVMNGWMNSAGHRANILRGNFCDLGVGYEAAGNYWTQDFARKSGVSECASAPSPNPPPPTEEPPQPPAEPPTPPTEESPPPPTPPAEPQPPAEEPPTPPVEPPAPSEPETPKETPAESPAEPISDPADAAPPSKPKKKFRNFKRFKKFGKFRRYNFGKFKRYRSGNGKRHRRVKFRRYWQDRRYWRYRNAKKRS